MRFFILFVAFVLTGASLMYAAGYRHIRHTPTADQKYGCTVAQQAPNGECQ